MKCGKEYCISYSFFYIFVQVQSRPFNILKQQQMRKFLALMLVGFGLVATVSSCGSSRGGHCDAYGSVELTPAEDLAKN